MNAALLPVSALTGAVIAQPVYRELILGVARKVKILGKKDRRSFENPTWRADWDGGTLPYESSHFDEVHSYHHLQRIGRQGDYESLFAHFSEIWRVLRPDGVLCLTLPSPLSDWLFGDPGHTRAITMQTITYLQQPEYDKQVLTTAMVDYRNIYKADFHPELLQDDGRELRVILQAVKPSRCSQ